MAKITIKTAHDQKGNQYWFAENENNKIFGDYLGIFQFRQIRFFLNWKFESLELLKKSLENYNKSKSDPEFVETLTF